MVDFGSSVTALVSSAVARHVMSMDRGILLLRIAFPLLAVAGPGGGESSPGSGDALPSLGGDTSPDEGPSAALGKRSTSDAAPRKGAADVKNI